MKELTGVLWKYRFTFNVPTYKLWWQENGQERHSVA